MELKLSKPQILKLIKEARKLSVKSFIKENVLTPKEEELVRRATRHGYKSSLEDYVDDPEAYQTLLDLDKEYNAVGFDGLSNLHKAIIDAQENNKERYRAALAGYDYDEEGRDFRDHAAEQEAYDAEYEKLAAERARKKLEQDEIDKIDNLYRKQDELSGIRMREGHPDIDEKMAEIEQDPEFHDFVDRTEKQNLEHQMKSDEEDQWWEDYFDGKMEREGSKREY